MNPSNLREKVLKKIRQASAKSKTRYQVKEPDLKAFVFKHPEGSLPETFAREFTRINGKFIYCRDRNDAADQLRKLIVAHKWKNVYATETFPLALLEKGKVASIRNLDEYTNADVSITECEALIARTGTIVVSSGAESSRKLSVFPPVHVVLAKPDQMFFDLDHAIKHLKIKYSGRYPSIISMITGPSRTADIEKTLVLGAHGPKDLFCFYINER
jgi:L-lactate dehydrogenase complex protein LldG